MQGALDGIHEYRIPAMVTAPDGTIVTVCDARVSRSGDAPNNIDLVMKRGKDNGRHWERMQVIEDFPGEEAAADPCLVVDKKRGAIWLFYDHALAEVQNGPEAGRENRYLRLLARRSSSNGAAWSDPVNLTPDLLEEPWEAVMASPGMGIQLRDGRLAVPCYTRRPDEDYSHVLLSGDGGDTWEITASPGPRTNECQLVEANDGTWIFNMRSNRRHGCRAVSLSRDDGQTWTAMEDHPELIEPRCQGSFIRFTSVGESDSTNRLVFSNPASKTARKRMTVRLSYDEGETWPVSKTIYEGPSAYSCLAVLKDGTIGVLYENGEVSPYEKITFARFDLAWLTEGRDSLDEGAQ